MAGASLGTGSSISGMGSMGGTARSGSSRVAGLRSASGPTTTVDDVERRSSVGELGVDSASGRSSSCAAGIAAGPGAAGISNPRVDHRSAQTARDHA